MTIDEIKEKIKALRKLRQEFANGPLSFEALQEAEQRLREELLDYGFYLSFVDAQLDYALFCNEE